MKYCVYCGTPLQDYETICKTCKGVQPGGSPNTMNNSQSGGMTGFQSAGDLGGGTINSIPTNLSGDFGTSKGYNEPAPSAAPTPAPFGDEDATTVLTADGMFGAGPAAVPIDEDSTTVLTSLDLNPEGGIPAGNLNGVEPLSRDNKGSHSYSVNTVTGSQINPSENSRARPMNVNMPQMNGMPQPGVNMPQMNGMPQPGVNMPQMNGMPQPGVNMPQMNGMPQPGVNMPQMNGMPQSGVNMPQMNGMPQPGVNMPQMNGMAQPGVNMPQMNGMPQPGVNMPQMNGMPQPGVNMPQMNGMPMGNMPQMNGNIPMGADAPQKEKKSGKGGKIALIAIIAFVLVAGLAVGAYFLFFSKSHKAKKLTKEYFAAIEDKDISGLIEMTIPKKLANDALKAYGSEIGTDRYGVTDYDSAMSMIKQVQASDQYKEIAGSVKIEISNLKVGKVSKFDAEDYINNFVGDVAKAYTKQGKTITKAELLEKLENESEMKVSEMAKYVEKTIEQFGLSSKDIMVVEVSFDAKISYNGQTINIKSEESAANNMLVYKYDGKYYCIPTAPIIAVTLYMSTMLGY